MSTEVFIRDAARRSRHRPRSMWTRKSGCAFTPRSQPESLIPSSLSARRPPAAIDESMTRVCPHDTAVQPFYFLLPGDSLSAQHQAVLCQSPPSPKTRLAVPPRCYRPAPTAVVRPSFPTPFSTRRSWLHPEGCLFPPDSNPLVTDPIEDRTIDPWLGRRSRLDSARVVRTSEEARFEAAEATSAYPPTP